MYGRFHFKLQPFQPMLISKHNFFMCVCGGEEQGKGAEDEEEEEQQYHSLKSLGSVTRCLTLILSLVNE